MLTKTLSEAKKKQRNILIKAMNNDIGSIDSSKDSWNPAQISERAKDISYIRSLVDTWNPAQLNEALKMLDLPVIDTWNPAQIEEQRRNLVFYLTERTLTGNPITLKILGNLTPEVTGLKVTMNPIQDLHGYDSPWVGGAGKNKLNDTLTALKSYNTDGTWVDNVYTLTGLTFTVTDKGIKVNGNATAHTYFYYIKNDRTEIEKLVGYKAVNVGYASTSTAILRFMNASSSTWNVANNDVLSPASSVVTFVWRFANNSTWNNVLFRTMAINTEESDTSYAPYENLCPISGMDSVTVTRTAGEDVETHTHTYSSTVYGGVDDFVSGEGSNEWGHIASYNGETLPGEWISDRDVYAPNTSPTTGAEVVYKLAIPTTITNTPEDISLLKGVNVLSTDGDSIELKYKQNF